MFTSLRLPLGGLENLRHILPVQAATLLQTLQLLLIHGLLVIVSVTSVRRITVEHRALDNFTA